MSALKSLYRMVIMAATVIIAVQGWHLYGPTNEQVKSIAARVIEAAHRALDAKSATGSVSLSPVDDPRSVPPPFADLSPAGSPSDERTDQARTLQAPTLRPTPDQLSPIHMSPPVTLRLDQVAPGGVPAPAGGQNDDLAGSVTGAAFGDESAAASGAGGRIDALLAWLAQQGVREPKLEPWGSSGRLYRFSCRAPWGPAANFSRPLESIAEEPLTAVEQVAAKIRQLSLMEIADNRLPTETGPYSLAR